jgi:hypothetical protein
LEISGFFVSAGVRFVVNAGEMLKIKMGIYLCGTEIGVTEQLLHRAQVAARLQNV